MIPINVPKNPEPIKAQPVTTSQTPKIIQANQKIKPNLSPRKGAEAPGKIKLNRLFQNGCE